jgi:phage-related holin
MTDTTIPTKEGALPHRVKPFILPMLNMADGAWLLPAQAAFTFTFGFWSSLPDVEGYLLAAMAFDMATGIACGLLTRGGLRARTISSGIIRRLVVFALVHYLGTIKVEVSGFRVAQAGAIFAVWYLFGECVSVAENLDELGAPLPAAVKNSLVKSRDAIARMSFPGAPEARLAPAVEKKESE